MMSGLTVVGQGPTEDLGTLVNGYAGKVSGQDFSYHSSIPIAKESLLVRATDGTSSMEWTTAPVPEGVATEFVTFIWLAGLGSSPGSATFELAINGRTALSFAADGSDRWRVDGADGTSLSFQSEFVDQHGDRFGYMLLRKPARDVRSGEVLNLRVTGGNQRKTSWYMTFQFPLESGFRLRAMPALIGSEGQEEQVCLAGILHVGEPELARIHIGGRRVEETRVVFGYNQVRVRVPAVVEPTEVSYRLEIGDRTWEGAVTLEPVRKWQVHFVQHTHTDIGYTRPQTDILGDHLRFIDYALDYCDNTDSYPEASRFRWTCEAAWAVDEYLKCRPPNQVARLLRRIAEGRIEVTGMYFNFDELPDEQTLAASLRPLARFRDLGIEVTTAMQNDVNGIAWCMNEYYHDLGVRYLNMGTHGHRALISFDHPTLFWWESPSGKRLLAFRAEHYMLGNTLFKIHGGDFKTFETELLHYLTGLAGKGYPYDTIAIQHSGFLTDNAPPSVAPATMIKKWNEIYRWPRLKSALASEFFEEMEGRHGEDLPVIRGAWPDWWTDGFGASAREVAATRVAQGDLIAHTAGLSMAALQGSPMPEGVNERIAAANTALLFYTEHTVGYSESVREPFHKHTKTQRAIKESYAWEASRRSRMLGEETLGLLQDAFAREEQPSLLVFNTLNWERSGVFTVYIDHQMVPRDAEFRIIDGDGNLARAQVGETHSDGAYYAIWVDAIPAFGYRKYRIEVVGGGTAGGRRQSGEARGHPDQPLLENAWYRMVLDPGRGVISSVLDKELGVELVDQGAPWKMGEFIYERLDNRAQMEAFRLDNYTREPLEKVWVDGFEKGAVWDTVRFRGNTRAARREGTYTFEVRLFHGEKRFDLAYFIEKAMVLEPEGIYNAFPFSLESGQWAFDVPGGEMRAGVDQVPGSANDWNTVQNYARLSNGSMQVMVSSREIPLMQFGGINTGRFEAGAVPETTHLYGWPMNNYWTTNFNPEQHGGIDWEYQFTSRAGQDPQDAVRFGWGNRIPLLARVVPGGGRGDRRWKGAWLQGMPGNLLLISALPEKDGHSALFHVRETGGKTADFQLTQVSSGRDLTCQPVDVTGRVLAEGTLTVQPYESKFYRVIWTDAP
jgi:hypothetical protein